MKVTGHNQPKGRTQTWSLNFRLFLVIGNKTETRPTDVLHNWLTTSEKNNDECHYDNLIAAVTWHHVLPSTEQLGFQSENLNGEQNIKYRNIIVSASTPRYFQSIFLILSALNVWYWPIATIEHKPSMTTRKRWQLTMDCLRNDLLCVEWDVKPLHTHPT